MNDKTKTTAILAITIDYSDIAWSLLKRILRSKSEFVLNNTCKSLNLTIKALSCSLRRKSCTLAAMLIAHKGKKMHDVNIVLKPLFH